MKNKDNRYCNRDKTKFPDNLREPPIEINKDNSASNPENFDEGDYEDINDNIPELESNLELQKSPEEGMHKNIPLHSDSYNSKPQNKKYKRDSHNENPDSDIKQPKF